MISCDCDSTFGTRAVGKARLVTCRTPRKCQDCGAGIAPGSLMYMQSMFCWDETRAAKPYFMCERCGDLIESLAELGYCFEFGDVLEQWREYLIGRL